VTALLRTPVRRIAFAVALSALVHALLLWLPHITLPRPDSQLPLLTAKLEAVPMQPHKPLPRKRKAMRQHKPRPAKPEPVPPPVLTSEAASPTAPIIPAAPETPVSAATAITTVQSSVAATSNTGNENKADVPHLPKHAQLRFAAYIGTNGLYIGEMRHNLEIYEDGHYTLHAELETVGLARLFKSYNLTQTSRGTLTPNGDLRPDEFSEERIDEHGKQDASSRFDWSKRQADFANGTKEPLPDGAQDILSFLYQLSQEPFNRELIPLSISNGKKLENYQLEISSEENEVITPMGKLRALHLRKVHGPGEEGLEIWLGLDYRMLPVKFREIDRSGKIAGELAIREIRLSDK
jgi:Protein of unknown function (DUF3108)